MGKVQYDLILICNYLLSLAVPGWTGLIMLVILLMLSISSLKLFRYAFLESIEKWATIRPPAKGHSNGIAFRWWADVSPILFAGWVVL